MKYLILALIGAAGGILGGMGMGGGTILIPMLTLFGGVEQHMAQAINLVSFIPMSIVALFIHFKHKLVKAKGLIPLIVTACLASVLCSWWAQSIAPRVLKLVFGIFVSLIGVVSLVIEIVRFVQKKKAKSKPVEKNDSTT